jgi:probable HAF family extracellular repeat protein
VTTQTPPLSTTQLLSAQNQANNIANSIPSSALGGNEFVFFAAFDGTDNGANPPADGSGDSQTTAVKQLYDQVVSASGNVLHYDYEPGVGTPGSLPFSSAWDVTVTAQSVTNATNAYNAFAAQATVWLAAHPGGSLTSMITSFSRGGAAAAIFAQMLYEHGLVNTAKQVLIQPGTVGAVSAALIIDPVLTGVDGNVEFPPNVQNLTVVQAQNEYRSYFEAANYAGDNAAIFPVLGNHGDAGDLYDNGLGGIYLGAYTRFFQKAGLNIAPVPASRAYNGTGVVHSESLIFTTPLDFYEQTYTSLRINNPNYLTVPRQTVPYGTNGVPATVTGSSTSFTTNGGDIVIGGSGYRISINFTSFVLLPDSSASIGGIGDVITVNDGATLDFTSNVVTLNETIRLTQNSKVIIDAPLAFRGTIYGFVPSDTLDLAGIGTATGATLSASNELTIRESGGETVSLNLVPMLNFSGDSFLIAPDGSGGSDVVAESDSKTISFTGDDEVLLVVDPGNLSGTTSNFAQGDTIDLADVGTAVSATLGNNNVLTVTEASGKTLSLQLDPSQSYGNATFLVDPDGAGGTLVEIEAEAHYDITPVSAPGATTTVVYGINNAGEAVGYYQGSSGLHGFEVTGGNFSNVDNPNATSSSTKIAGINNTGELIGSYEGPVNSTNLIGVYGFVESAGTATNITVPGLRYAAPAGINDRGDIVGAGANQESQLTFGNFTSFIDIGGSFTLINAPNSSGTDASGINNVGQVVGTYQDGQGTSHGFLYQAGAFTTINAPGATSTRVFGINNTGEIVGLETDVSGTHVFVLSGTHYTITDIPQASNVVSLSINDAGQIGVFESEATGATTSVDKSFIATPAATVTQAVTPPPGNTALQYGQDAGDTFIFAGTAAGNAPTLQFLGTGGTGANNTTGALVVTGTPNAPAYGNITQAANANVVDSGGFQISNGTLLDSMAAGTTLSISNTGTIANSGTVDISSNGQGTFSVSAAINLSARGTNVLNLNGVAVTGAGVIDQQGENDATYVSSVAGTDFEISGGVLTLANPTGFNGTIGPISATAGAPSIGAFSQIDILNAINVAKGSFDTTTGMLSLLNASGTDIGNVHFAGVATGLRLTQEPARGSSSAYLAINDQGTSGNGAGGNIPLTFHT